MKHVHIFTKIFKYLSYIYLIEIQMFTYLWLVSVFQYYTYICINNFLALAYFYVQIEILSSLTELVLFFVAASLVDFNYQNQNILFI